MASFTLAHFSDVHLGPLPQGAALTDFSVKRLIGAMSWKFKRRKLHLPEIANQLMADIAQANPDHVAFTGDLVNIAAVAEFEQGLNWLKKFAAPDWLSFTPGNHDAYVKLPWEKGLEKFEPFMSSDMKQAEAFPFIRLRRNIALIGVNGAIPQNLLRAGGMVGAKQRESLQEKLKSLRERGFYRVVMIHHPPAAGLAHHLRALTDVFELQKILEHEGAELVIHGHNHVTSLNWLNSQHGDIPVIGVPSASMTDGHGHDPAAWNLYRIDRAKGQWQTHLVIHQWNSAAQAFKTATEFELKRKSDNVAL